LQVLFPARGLKESSIDYHSQKPYGTQTTRPHRHPTNHPTQDNTLPSNYTYWLHAWFLDQIRQLDPNLSAELHNNQTEKAFTLSGFLPATPTNHTINFSASNTYQFQITALNKNICTALKNWQTPTSITLRNSTFQITDRGASSEKNRQTNLPATTYKTLWDNTNLDNELNLSFLSATAFHKNGNHMPLPIPENLFHSYLRRWNIFSEYQFDPEEFLIWVREGVVLLRHNIRSIKVQPGKQGSVTGFIGNIQLGITNKALYQVDFSHLAHALIAAAPYFGTGHKVTFGLGQTRSGWAISETPAKVILPFSDQDAARAAKLSRRESISNSAKKSRPAAVGESPVLSITVPGVADEQKASKSNEKQSINSIAELSVTIDARIAELQPIFLASKKRQGGDRAANTALLWATIVARQEAGDNLKSISIDLGMPYDSVKKCSQLARKYLLSINKK
jgi:CRISPR-associated endoribonuclease Cas6